jgi:type VI protein secretion system component VasF
MMNLQPMLAAILDRLRWLPAGQRLGRRLQDLQRAASTGARPAVAGSAVARSNTRRGLPIWMYCTLFASIWLVHWLAYAPAGRPAHSVLAQVRHVHTGLLTSIGRRRNSYP